MVSFCGFRIAGKVIGSLNNIQLGINPRGEYMSEATIGRIKDPDIREELSDKLEQYVHGASEEVAQLFETIAMQADERVGKRISEILIASIYIPMMMGEDKYKIKVDYE